ncbi:MAG: hypothetical protein ABI340_07980 [Nitrososphaera sp.]|jgi:hypothetical protein
MIFVELLQSNVSMTTSGLWWDHYGNYVLAGIVAITITVCYFVLRKKEK